MLHYSVSAKRVAPPVGQKFKGQDMEESYIGKDLNKVMKKYDKKVTSLANNYEGRIYGWRLRKSFSLFDYLRIQLSNK